MASIYTLGALTTVITAEARLGLDAAWPIAVKALIEEALIDAVVRDKPREYLKTNVALTPSTSEWTIPTDFLIPERLQYTSSSLSWELCDERHPVCPARVQGKPAAFKFTKDASTGIANRLILLPAYISGADTLLLDYYYRPNVTNDSDEITYDRGIPSIKMIVLQRLQIIQNKPADQLSQVLQGYVMAARKDLSQDDSNPLTK